MLSELVDAARELNISRQAVIKTLSGKTLIVVSSHLSPKWKPAPSCGEAFQSNNQMAPTNREGLRLHLPLR
jgi:hypothetical protein